MINYFVKYYDKLIFALLEHLQIVFVTLVLSLLLAAILTLLCIYFNVLKKVLLSGSSMIYSVPSLAMFAIMIPLTGLGKTTAIIVLVIYNQYLLLRNFLTGLEEVDKSIIDAATGMGNEEDTNTDTSSDSTCQKALFAGIRLAIVSTIGIATIAASINAGGLGTILFDGLRTMNTNKIIWGSILSAGLAVVANYTLDHVEKRFNKKQWKGANKMRAIVLEKPVKSNDLKVSNVPIPKVKPGWVLIKVKAFGINRSEIFTRNGLSPSVLLPRIIGIECVGEIVDPSDSSMVIGQKVISMMGGLGRDFDGGYAEYVLIPIQQVYPVDTHLEWTELAAMPEMYYTSWCSLTDTLKLKQEETILIRGATSSVGLASIQLAKAFDATVIATTRNQDKSDLLRNYGADYVLIDDETIEEQMQIEVPAGADKILELIGTKTLKSSFGLLKQRGILCVSGILGGEWELAKFAPMDFIPSGSYLTIYDSKIVNKEKLVAMLDFVKVHKLKPPIAKVFSLEEITQAHELMESNEACGKIIVVV